MGDEPRVESFPVVRQVVLDCHHPRPLAEFWRVFLGWAYRPGDEPPPPGDPDPVGDDWLVLRPASTVDPGGGRGGQGLAFQASASYVAPVWDAPGQQQMLHLDLTVADVDELAHQRRRAEALGARLLLDRSDDEHEPLHVLADPAGHPFCVFVA